MWTKLYILIFVVAVSSIVSLTVHEYILNLANSLNWVIK